MNQRAQLILSSRDAHRLLGKMIQACLDFSQKRITLKQLWYRFRGYRTNLAIQRCPDPVLSSRLLTVYMDFLSWNGERDDLITDSANRVASLINSMTGQRDKQ